MPIRPFLADQAFDPEVITAMSLALERVCDALRLKAIDDIATRLIAEKIIKQAQRGIPDPDTLVSRVLQDLQPDGSQLAASRDSRGEAVGGELPPLGSATIGAG
jgi:hypothetical protein